MPAPDRIRIPYEDDEYGRFTDIGRLPDGTQFMAFVTGAYPTGDEYYSGPDWQQRKRWLAVLHCFDSEGNHLGSESHLGGFDAEGTDAACWKASEHLEVMLASLAGRGRPVSGDVWVRPFAVELDGVTHGLIYECSVGNPEEATEHQEWVMLQPQDIMFHPPWDSGDYST